MSEEIDLLGPRRAQRAATLAFAKRQLVWWSERTARAYEKGDMPRFIEAFHTRDQLREAVRLLERSPD